MKDYVIRAIDKEKSIRVFIATTTKMIEEARKFHNTFPTATAALGRAITASSIMGIMQKNANDKLTLQFKGDGPLKSILTVANSKGEVKGYVANPSVDIPLKENGKLDVGAALGKNGRLIVIRDFGLKEPYIGQANLVTGEIAEDLAHYFANSEQQPSAVALGTLVDKDLSVRAAGGFIVQVLPNISDELINKLEHKINVMKPISTLIDNGYTPEDILSEIFGDFNMEIIDEIEVGLFCDCSRERMEKSLITLGKKELEAMIEEDNGAELVCHFCNKRYFFDEDNLRQLMKDMQ